MQRLKVENRKQKRENKNKQEDKVMKTKNNVQKTNFKTIVLLTCLALTGISVNAQAYLRSISQNNSLNGNAMVMASKTKLGATTNRKVEVSKKEAEAPLKMENWMTGSEFYRVDNFVYETEKEMPLDLEDWMTDGSAFKISTAVYETEMEFPLEIEPWMISDNFGGKTVNGKISKQSAEKETALELETWMLASSYWK